MARRHKGSTYEAPEVPLLWRLQELGDFHWDWSMADGFGIEGDDLAGKHVRVEALTSFDCATKLAEALGVPPC